MTQSEVDHIRGIVRVKAPGCGEIVVRLRQIVDRALAAATRSFPRSPTGGEEP